MLEDKRREKQLVGGVDWDCLVRIIFELVGLFLPAIGILIFREQFPKDQTELLLIKITNMPKNK